MGSSVYKDPLTALIKLSASTPLHCNVSRSGLEAVTSQQQSAGAALEQLLASAQSRDRGQTKTNERIDEHIQVSGGQNTIFGDK